ncbi:MAG: right-handed parallel beta-helix repeat-containing protein [Lysobacterales bacterium]
MMTRSLFSIATAIGGLLFCTLSAKAAPLETTFTYQGELLSQGVEANGTFDLQMSLFDESQAGTQRGVTQVLEDVMVIDGIFSVEMDYGFEPFAGDQLWLDISVRNGSSSGGFTNLLPRQKLTATPYALHAETVAAGAISSTELAPGSVGLSQVDTSQVQRRVTGVCGAGFYAAGVGQDGSLQCVADQVGVDAAGAIAAMGAQASGNPLNHARYTDVDSVNAVLAADGPGSGIDADLLDGQNADELIAAASVGTSTEIPSVPFTINSPGSYHLADNLTHSNAQTDAIQINADNVSLDLRGFTLTGPGSGSGANNNGIRITIQQNVTIYNGQVEAFGGRGIYENNSVGRNYTLRDLRVFDNGLDGISMFSRGNLVLRCHANDNGQDGINAGLASVVRESTASFNARHGIVGGAGGPIDTTVITYSTANSNGDAGIRSQSKAVISYNSSSQNGSSGISASTSSIVGNSTANNASHGISATSSLISQNSVSGNASSGIRATSSRVFDNIATSNNTSLNVSEGGIHATSNSMVVGNLAQDNDQNNIYVSASDNVIDGNHVVDVGDGSVPADAAGIRFISSDNLFRNNTATGNTNGFFGLVPPVSRNINNISW